MQIHWEGKVTSVTARAQHSRLLTLSWQRDNKEQQACISVTICRMN